MRIDRTSTAGAPAPSSARTRLAGQGFTLGGADGARKAGTVGTAAPLGSLDALLALQGEEDPAERRRRSLRRGHDLLDSLDRLKVALLDGRAAGAHLATLAAQVRHRDPGSGDPALDELLAHIDLRAQVELAKLDRARA